MIPIPFLGHNVVLGAGQPEYLPLPAMVLPDGEIISCWQLSEEELVELQKTKCIYISQFTFGRGFQPILPKIDLSDGIELKHEER